MRSALLMAVFSSACTLSACTLGKVYLGEGGKLGATISHGTTGEGSGTTAGTATAGATTGTGAGTTAGSTGQSVHIDPDAPGCGHAQVAPTSVTPVHFLFTLDRSKSMLHAIDDNTPSKWQALQGAMSALFDQMGNDAAAGDAALAVGVDYFSESDNSHSPGTDSFVERPMQQLDRAWADTLMADIEARNANGFTPTEAALHVSYDAMSAYDPSGTLAGGEKVVVLVSDGVPNPALSSDTVVRDLVTGMRTATPRIRTFAIGIGELDDQGYDALFMSEIAAYGGGGRAGCDASSSDPAKFCHFQVTPSASSANITADLLAAFSAIRQQVRSCDLPLVVPDATTLEPRAVAVVAEKDGAQRLILKDATNGWAFDDDAHPTLVRLNGAECDLLKNDPGEKVFAILGCTCVGGSSTGSTTGVTTGGESSPARQSESGGETGGDWNTNWCSYPFVPGNECTGESCR